MKPVKAVSMEKLTDSSLELECEQQHQVNWFIVMFVVLLKCHHLEDTDILYCLKMIFQDTVGYISWRKNQKPVQN